jgi:hypothetical protein
LYLERICDRTGIRRDHEQDRISLAPLAPKRVHDRVLAQGEHAGAPRREEKARHPAITSVYEALPEPGRVDPNRQAHGSREVARRVRDAVGADVYVRPAAELAPGQVERRGDGFVRCSDSIPSIDVSFDDEAHHRFGVVA